MNIQNAQFVDAGDQTHRKVRVGVYLPQDFPLAPLALVLEALRIANSVDGRSAFSHHLISADGAPVQSSCNLPFPVEHSIKDTLDCDVILVCAGANSVDVTDRRLLNWLRRLHSHGVRLGAISSGAFVLAHAGLLDGLSCAVHWESARALSERFTKVNVTKDIFCVDSRIITCAGGMSTLDLMLHLISEFRGRYFARVVADKLIYQSIRSGHEPARIDIRTRTGTNSPLLLQAVQIMEQTLGEPLKIGEIAQQLETSVRHLERLFHRSFHASPSSYYMTLRLNEAKSLLMQTDISVLEIALSCGFRSSSHFTRKYRESFDTAPRTQRRLRQPGAVHARS